MKDMLVVLESAATAGSRVSLLMAASSIVLTGCSEQVQSFVRRNQLEVSGALCRFSDDYAQRVSVAIDLGHLAADWLAATRRDLERALERSTVPMQHADPMVRQVRAFARQVLEGLDVAQRAVQQSEDSAAASIESLREAVLRTDSPPEVQATIEGLLKRISRPSGNP